MSNLCTLAIIMSCCLLWGCGSDDEPTAQSNTDSTSKTTVQNPQAQEHSFTKTSGPLKNPHKGWHSAWFDTFDEATVGFQYLTWRDFEPQDNVFNFDAVENVIAFKGSFNKHFVLRLHCEYSPTDAQSNCPQWLYSEKGVQRIAGADNKFVTDFNSPIFIQQAKEAIAALGQRYNQDPRVHAFQLGVLGYWGEWHTHGFYDPNAKNGYFLSENTKREILQAYKTHFSLAILQGRYPWESILKEDMTLGFHNDYFIPQHDHSTSFDAAIEVNELWRYGPIGGETPPRSEVEVNLERALLFNTSSGEDMIKRAHYSTMNGGYRVDPGHSFYEQSMKLHKLMGYNFQIENAYFPNSLQHQQPLEITLVINNIGVAPLYHPWSVQFALLDSSDQIVTQSTPKRALTGLNPQTITNLFASLSTEQLAPQNYRLAVRFIQVDADKSKAKAWQLDARNTYIELANDLPTIAGVWGPDNALEGGWSILGSINLLAKN